MYPGKLGEALDPIELRILKLYGEGLYRQEIAKELFLSPATIRKYEGRIRKRLGARHTHQAIFLAHERGFFNQPEEPMLFHVNRAQALACWTLAFSLEIGGEFEITDQDNYGALITRHIDGRRWKLPVRGGVVELEPEAALEEPRTIPAEEDPDTVPV